MISFDWLKYEDNFCHLSIETHLRSLMYLTIESLVKEKLQLEKATVLNIVIFANYLFFSFQVFGYFVHTSWLPTWTQSQPQNQARNSKMCRKILASAFVTTMVFQIFEKNYYKRHQWSTCQFHRFLWLFGGPAIAQRSKQGLLELLWIVYSEGKLQSCLKLRNFQKPIG